MNKWPNPVARPLSYTVLVHFIPMKADLWRLLHVSEPMQRGGICHEHLHMWSNTQSLEDDRSVWLELEDSRSPSLVYLNGLENIIWVGQKLGRHTSWPKSSKTLLFNGAWCWRFCPGANSRITANEEHQHNYRPAHIWAINTQRLNVHFNVA